MKTSLTTPILSTLLAVSIATFSSNTFAAVISQSDTFSTSLPVSGDGLSMDEESHTVFGFSAFDSTLGDLTEVRVEISGTQGLDVALFNENTIGGDYSFNSNYGYSVGNFSNGSPIETGASFIDSANGFLEAAESIDVSFGPHTAFENFVLIGPDLLPFIDSGLFELTVGIFQDTNFYVATPSSENNGFHGNTDLEVTVNIQYLYEPTSVSVPEPASLMLLGMGLFAFRRFKRT